jgi:hypothetical protein
MCSLHVRPSPTTRAELGRVYTIAKPRLAYLLAGPAPLACSVLKERT